MYGELSEVKQNDTSIQVDIVDKVRQAAEHEAGRNFQQFVATHKRFEEVNCGRNYLFKVDVGGGFVHLRVYQPLPPGFRSQPKLDRIQVNKTADAELIYFE